MIRNIYLKYEVDPLINKKKLQWKIFYCKKSLIWNLDADADAGASRTALHILRIVELKWANLIKYYLRMLQRNFNDHPSFNLVVEDV
jgi:hypothetical protein